MFHFHIILSRHQFPVLSLFGCLSGLPSSSASFNCGWHPLHPYLSGLHPRAVGPAPVGKAGEPSQPTPSTPPPLHIGPGSWVFPKAVHAAALFLNHLQMSAQIFAIQLLSQLCTQYALPKSLSVARLAISVMGTLLTGECRTFCLYTH